MRLLDIIASPWAIRQEKLDEIVAIYRRHLRGEKIDLKGIEFLIGGPINDVPEDYQVTPDGVAIIPVEGVLGKKMNMFSKISGGSSMQIIGNNIQDALSQKNVRAIVLQVSSPGGTVEGTAELAAIAYAARGQKPIIAHSDGMIASAAYWIASAADAIWISGNTVGTGSIGVRTIHEDISRALEMEGVKVTDIYSGRYKNVGTPYTPLSGDHKAVIQAELDYLYTEFVNTVARNRGLDAAQHDVWADAKWFIGEQAVPIGLVDGMMPFEELVATLAQGNLPGPAIPASAGDAGKPPLSQEPPSNGGIIEVKSEKEEEKSMKAEELKAQFPATWAEIEGAGHARGLAEGKEIGHGEGHAAGLKEGAAAELKRIQDVAAQALPGHEALVQTLMYDGKTTGPEAAEKILAAEKTTRAKNLKGFIDDGPAVPHANAPADGAPPAATEGGSIEAVAKAAWDKTPDLRAEFGDNFANYLSFKKQEAAGNARIQNKSN